MWSIKQIDPEFIRGVMVHRNAEEWVKRNRWLKYVAKFSFLRRAIARAVAWHFLRKTKNQFPL